VVNPALEKSGTATLVFAQCFSGGLVEALEPQLSDVDKAYAMAAANAYEVSNGYGFAEGVELSLYNANPLVRDLFRESRLANPFSFRGSYEPNGGDRLPNQEHPWAYPGSGGDFSVFAGETLPHPLVRQGIEVEDEQAWAASGTSDSLQLNLLEDESLDVRSALVASGVVAADAVITAVRLPERGRLNLDESGVLQYSPLANVNGRDALGLQVQGPSGVRRFEVSLAIAAVNDSPEAADDRLVVASGSSGTRFSVDPLTGFLGDFDIDGDELTIVEYTNPAHGWLRDLGGGSFVYTPKQDFTGEGRFFYRVSDGISSSVAEVIIDVGGSAFRVNRDGSYSLASVLTDEVFNPIREADGSLLSESSSSRWDVVDAVRLDDRYALLLESEQWWRRGQYKVWEASLTGGLLTKGDWLTPRDLRDQGYE